MIRGVTIASLVAILMIVLYLPAARPAAAFLAQIRAEHTLLSEYWGKHHALAMLAKMLELQPTSTPNPPLIQATNRANSGNGIVQGEVAAVGARLLNNDYFRSLNSLLLLALYRSAVLMHLVPGFVPFLLAALVDGLVRRNIKRTDFTGHNPEVFSACTCGVIVVGCTTVVACVIPIQLSPLCLPVLLMAACGLMNFGIANYHKRA